MKPLLLLDIDGVLCPYDMAEDHEFPVIPGHHAAYDPGHTPHLQKLNELYDISWASMWEGDANVVISPLHGLGSFPFVPFRETFDAEKFASALTFKLDGVEKFIEDDQPVAWVDDDFFSDAFQWADRRNETAPTLLVKTDHSVGLTTNEAEQLINWPSTWPERTV